MIQIGTKLQVIDNSGARIVRCLKVYSGYKRRYARFSNVILVSVIKIRNKRRTTLKVKKGEIRKAIILKTTIMPTSFSGDKLNYLSGSAVVLLGKPKKLLGTRIFGSLSKNLRFTKFLRVLCLASHTHKN